MGSKYTKNDSQKPLDSPIHLTSFPHSSDPPPSYDEATNRLDRIDLADTESEIDLLETDMNSMENSANQFFQLCEQVKQSDDGFNQCFADWFENRAELIARLNEFVNKMDITHLRCNVSTISGSSLGMFGASVGLIGLAVAPPAAIVGAVMAGTGGVANLMTGIAEFGINRKKQKQVKILLHEDMQKTGKLVERLEMVVADWKTLWEVTKQLNHPYADESLNANVRLLNERCCLSILGINAKLAMAYSVRQVAADVVEGVAESSASALARALSHTALTISLLLDGYTIISTAKDMNKKGSPFGRQLRELNDQLEVQAKDINRTRRALNERRASVLSRIVCSFD